MINEAGAAERGPSSMKAASGLMALVKIGRTHGLPLTLEQLIHDNALSGEDIAPEDLVRCARNAGLKAKAVKLSWDGLTELKRALPVIVRLKGGSNFILVRIEGGDEQPVAILQEPRVEGDELLTIERTRFEDAWTSEVILLRRDYDLVDEEQPFSLGLITALIFRERRIVRDVAMCAVALSFFALAPIIFFRLLSDKVIYFHAMSTFTALCLTMGAVVVFETIFGYLRASLLVVLTSRIDIRLSEYMFDKVLRLPIDFFERNQVGKIGRDMNEIWRIRTFLTSQLFGTILDSATLLFFLPVMFAFSPLLDSHCTRSVRVDCRVAPFMPAQIP